MLYNNCFIILYNCIHIIEVCFIFISLLQTPHLLNLNEDPLMSECLLYYLKDGITRYK